MYHLLRDKLIDGTFDVTETHGLIDAIYQTLPCLGILCEDVGQYYSDSADQTPSPACANAAPMRPLAGYHPLTNSNEVSPWNTLTIPVLTLHISHVPRSFSIPQFARLDLDLRQVEILMEMDSYEAAKNLYLYGKHAGSVSLSRIGAGARRAAVPAIGSFSQYYGSDSFPNDFVVSAISGESTVVSSKSDRVSTVLRATQSMVMYIGILAALHDVPAECESDGGFVPSWDNAGALYIGNLEGTSNGGSPENGYLLFHLAQEHCQEFNTCTSNHTAMINEKLVSLLYAGRGAAKSRSCEALAKAAEEIQRLVPVPMIQALLSAGIRLSRPGSSRRDVVEAYTISRAILPQVAAVDRRSAEVLEKIFNLDGKHPPADEKLVFAAFSRVYEGMGINCRNVGWAEGGLEACKSYDDVDLEWFLAKGSGNHKGPSKTIVGAITIAMVVLVAFLLILRMESKKKSRRMNPLDVTREEAQSFLERKASFPSKSTPLSSEAVRLTTNENREGTDEEDSDESDATVVTSNIDIP